MRKNKTRTRSFKDNRFTNLRHRVLSAAIIAVSQTAWVSLAIAGPDGGRVAGGDGSIGRDGRNTTIHQRSNRMAIDWDSYNVAADEVVTYIQPGAEAISLNRILSHNGSEIHGQINANGQVILVNPHGVFFGKNAQVNVGGLIASGMTMDVSDFMSGDFTFSAVEGAEGKVINQGLINAATGGSVTLLGKQVRNDGLISARLGAVNLAAGKEAVVTFDEAGLMGVRVSKEILQDELGVDAAVLNTGEIKANGGRILLSSSTSRDIFSQAVNRGDLEQASSAVVHEDGSFTLGGGADVVNTGTLNVSSADRGAGDIVVLGENITQAGTVAASTQGGTNGIIELHATHTTLLTEDSFTVARSEGRGRGGQIKVLGHHVGLLDQATVDSSGAWGGGQVYIGGDYQGDNPFMPNAWRSFVGDKTRIKANALTEGDGGRVIVWADDIARFFGKIESKGAGGNGKGGFAEVSGKNQLRFDGLTDLRGPGGVGTLLLDPRDIIIEDTRNGANIGPDVLFGDGGVDEDFHITPDTLQDNLANADVKLEATRDIFVNSSITAHSNNTNSLTLHAGRNIEIGFDISLGHGDLSLIAGVASCGLVECYSGVDARNVEVGGVLNTQGAIDIRAADNITLKNHIGIDSRPTFFSLRAGSDITIDNDRHSHVSAAPDTAAISLLSGDTTLFSEGLTVAPAGGEGKLLIGGNLNSYGTADTRGGNIFLNSTGELTLNGDVMTEGGHFTVGEEDGLRPSDFNMAGHTVRTGTRGGGTGLDAGNIAIYTNGSANLGVMDLALNYSTVDHNGGANSIGTITVDAGRDITLHADLDFNDFGPRTTEGFGDENLEDSKLSLTAGRNITIDGEIFDQWGDGRDALNIELKAGEALSLNNDIYTSGGNFTASAREIGFGRQGQINTRFANDLRDDVDPGPARHGHAQRSTGANVTLEAETAITLGNVATHGCDNRDTCTGNLILRGRETGEEAASPTITQLHDPDSGLDLDIAGTTTINIGTGAATLDSTNNKFLGAVSGSAKGLIVSGGDDGLRFGALTLTGDLTASATGNITDLEGAETENIIQVDGAATFNTNGHSLLLDERAHQFSSIAALHNVREVELTNGRDLDVGAITTTGAEGTVDIEATGNLSIASVNTQGDTGNDGGDITLLAGESGTLTVGMLNANGGRQSDWRGGGFNSGTVTLTAAEVLLQGSISSQGSAAGAWSSNQGTSGNITIHGNTIIAPEGSDTIVVNNAGVGGSASHSGHFILNGTLNGDGLSADASANIMINSADVTFNGEVGGSHALGELVVNTYGDVAFNMASFPQVNRIEVNGQTSGHTLTAPNMAGEWTLTGGGDGDLRVVDAGEGEASIEFTNMFTLVGSDFDDQFIVDTTRSISFYIQAVRNESTKNNTDGNKLTAANRDNTWTIFEGSESTLNDHLTFTGVQNLVGGSRDDAFNIVGATPFSGVIDGGAGGANKLDLSRLTGLSNDNTWAITDTDGGTLSYGSATLEFSEINDLTGGSGNDIFTFTENGAITGRIDGGGVGESVANKIYGRNADSRWTIDSDSERQLGSIDLVTPDDNGNGTFTPYLNEFTGIHSLVGGEGNDQFVYKNGVSLVAVDGGGGTANSVDFSALESAEVVLGDGSLDHVTNIQKLTGGGDNFTLRVVSGNNRWALDEFRSGKIGAEPGGNENFEVEYTFINFAELIGSGTDTLIAHNAENHWKLDSRDGGALGVLNSGGGLDLTTQLTFSGMEHLIGGGEEDHFVLSGPDVFRGTVNGGSAGGNSLELMSAVGSWVLTEAHNGTLKIDESELIFENMKTLKGSGGDSLTAVGQETVWSWSPDSGGSVTQNDPDVANAPLTEFSGMSRLIGGGSVNTLQSSTAGGAWKMTELQGGELSVNGESVRFESMQILKGSGSDSLTGLNQNNHWLITSANGGELSEDSAIGEEHAVRFSGMNKLTGVNRADRFVLNSLFSGTLDGGENRTGNRIESNLADGDWVLTGAMEGTLNTGLTFKNVQSLRGGSGNDEFSLGNIDRDALSSFALIDGGVKGDNTLDLTGQNGDESLTVAVVPGRHEDANANLEIRGIHTLKANNNGNRNTLAGPDREAGWTVTGADKGTVKYTEVSDDDRSIDWEMEFEGFANLLGGHDNDRFDVEGGDIAGGINGGGGVNLLDYSASRDDVVVTIGGNDSGLPTVSNIHGVIGNHDPDAVGSYNSKLIVGRDTSGNGINQWLIAALEGHETSNGINDGIYDKGGDQEFYFINFNQLVGGSGDDTFTFLGDGQITGSIDGGGGANRIDATDASLGHMFSLRNIGEPSVFIRNIDGLRANGDYHNVLLGANRDNTWRITTDGGGALNENVEFEGFYHLVGGSQQDEFVLSGAGSIAQIDGGSGQSTVELVEGMNNPLLIGLSTTDADGDIVAIDDTDIQLANISEVNAAATDGHVLVGSYQNNTWRIDGENAGALNSQVSFSGFEYLLGNKADDTFEVVGDGVITGGIDGGGGGNNTLDVAALPIERALTIALRDYGQADLFIKNINAIDSAQGAQHTLVASNETNNWSITDTNAGALSGLSFTGMAKLVGGSRDDTFTFTATGQITDLIDGGGHDRENTLDYSRVAGLDIRLGEGNDFTNIQHLVGDSINSTLQAADQTNVWLLEEGVNTGWLNDELRFTGITNLMGGAGLDTFNVNGGALTGGIQAGEGDSALNLTIGSEANGRLSFFGGPGSDRVTVNGGGDNYAARYAVSQSGQESLSYTGESGAHYELTYQGVAEVQDRVSADSLELHGSSQTDEMILRGNSFSIPGYSALHFHNKHNLTLAASSQHHIKLEGAINIPGTFEIRNAQVTQQENQARIGAHRLILNNVAGFGSGARPINTSVTEADIRLGRADLHLHNQGRLSVNELTGSGTVTVQTEGELSSTNALSLSGPASFVSRYGDITLTGDNRLSGDITLSAAGNIALTNNRDTRLQRVQAQNFTLASKGRITAPGPMVVDGLATLTADDDIALTNDHNHLNEVEVRRGENVSIHSASWLNIAHVHSNGDVYTRTEGLQINDGVTANSLQFDAGERTAILDGRLDVSTLTGQAQGITVGQAISVDRIELDSRGGSLELNAELETRQDLALRGTNVEQNAALLSGAGIRVASEANYHQRADVTAKEGLWISANDDITMESDALSHAHNGEIHYQAGNNIALTHLNASGSTVSLSASRGAISNNNGTDANVTADRLEMRAASGIGRDTSLITDIHVLDAQSKSGRLAVTNQGELQVDRMVSNGNVRLSNRTGHIFLNSQDGPVFDIAEPDALLAGGTLSGNYDLGTVVIEVADGSLFALGEAHAHKPDLVGREVFMLASNGTVGSRSRPLVAYARDLSSTIAGHTWPMWWAFGEEPRQVENDSGIPQELLDFASAGSAQLVEVESLEDINPAIFTEVRNYTYGNVSVLLPPDQQYGDEDNY